MKKNGIITLILSALILVSCSDVPYTTGKIGLSGARMALSQAPISVEKITAELKNNKTGETKKEFRTVNEDGFSEDITWDELPPNEEYTLTVSAEGTWENYTCIYKGSSVCRVVPGKMTYVKVTLKKEYEYQMGDYTDPANRETNSIKTTEGFIVERNLSNVYWKVDSTGMFIPNQGISNYTELFNVYENENARGDDITVPISSVEPVNNFAWSSIGEGYCKITFTIDDKVYSAEYPIVHKYVLSDVDIGSANQTVNKDSPLSFRLSSKANGSVSVFLSTSETKTVSFSEISQIAYNYNILKVTDNIRGTSSLSEIISISLTELSKLGINEEGSYAIEVSAKQVVNSEYSKYFYYEGQTEPKIINFTVNLN